MPMVKRGHAARDAVEPRVLIQDVIPYKVPDRLEDLRGPAEGVLKLPQHVYWGPQADCDLSERVIKTYQAILREAPRADQEALMNVAPLTQVWPHLMLPVRCGDLWETKFPQLACARDSLQQSLHFELTGNNCG